MSQCARVAVVDDHPAFREALSSIVRHSPEFELAGAAADGPAGLELVRRTKPDIVLVDLNMPGLHGVELTERIRSLPDPPSVVVFSMLTDSEATARAKAAGACAALRKDRCVDDLVEVLRAVGSAERQTPLI